MWKTIKDWFISLFKEEYELEIFFPGDAQTAPDGTKIEKLSPKLYTAKSIKKITPTHFIFTDTNGIPVEIKTVNPVGYNLKKTY